MNAKVLILLLSCAWMAAGKTLQHFLQLQFFYYNTYHASYWKCVLRKWWVHRSLNNSYHRGWVKGLYTWFRDLKLQGSNTVIILFSYIVLYWLYFHALKCQLPKTQLLSSVLRSLLWAVQFGVLIIHQLKWGTSSVDKLWTTRQQVFTAQVLLQSGTPVLLYKNVNPFQMAMDIAKMCSSVMQVLNMLIGNSKILAVHCGQHHAHQSSL